MKALLRWLKEVYRGFNESHCSLHAAGLTYFSTLAIVPIVCVLLALAKVVGLDSYAQREVNRHLDAAIANIEHGQDDGVLKYLPIADEEEREERRVAASFFASQARRIADDVFKRVKNFNIGTFGWVGFALLLWTVISSLSMVEVTFNEIWGVREPRPVWKRALICLGVLLALPALSALAVVLKYFSILFLVLGFALFFYVMPNARVKFRAALLGGLVTTLLFGAWLKVCAVAQVGLARSSALYGSFAVIPIILAWLYMSWEIILLGANMVRSFEKR